MKRSFTLLLTAALLLSLAACGKQAPAKADLNAVYDAMTPDMPPMLRLDNDMALNYFGINPADCTQLVTAIAEDSMTADEVWLIEAVDKAALDRILALAETRLTARAEECESYSPEQYAIVKKAETVTKELYLALLVGPEAQKLKQTFEAGFAGK